MFVLLKWLSNTFHSFFFKSKHSIWRFSCNRLAVRQANSTWRGWKFIFVCAKIPEYFPGPVSKYYMIMFTMWNFTDSKRFIQKCHTVQNIIIDVCDSIGKPMDATINTQTNWIIFFLVSFEDTVSVQKNYNIYLHVLYLQPPKHS